MGTKTDAGIAARARIPSASIFQKNPDNAYLGIRKQNADDQDYEAEILDNSKDGTNDSNQQKLAFILVEPGDTVFRSGQRLSAAVRRWEPLYEPATIGRAA